MEVALNIGSDQTQDPPEGSSQSDADSAKAGEKQDGGSQNDRDQPASSQPPGSQPPSVQPANPARSPSPAAAPSRSQQDDGWTRFNPGADQSGQAAPAAPVSPMAPAEPNPASPPPPAPSTNTVTIADGTLISIRLAEPLSTQRNRAGDAFSSTLADPLLVDGFVIAERGARVEGKITESEQPARAKGLAHLTLELRTVHTSDGQDVPLRTAAVVKQAPEAKGDEVAKVGVGAVFGTILGAAAGGGKGAAIGAAAGGAAGAGTVAATRGKTAALPIETRLDFRLAQPVTITEQRR